MEWNSYPTVVAAAASFGPSALSALGRNKGLTGVPDCVRPCLVRITPGKQLCLCLSEQSNEQPSPRGAKLDLDTSGQNLLWRLMSCSLFLPVPSRCCVQAQNSSYVKAVVDKDCEKLATYEHEECVTTHCSEGEVREMPCALFRKCLVQEGNVQPQNKATFLGFCVLSSLLCAS